ncbi:MAG: S8 family serine peptidase [Pyrinomonadaceae bacterium]
MNRKNIWIHVCIAVVIVTLAAVLGQIRHWEKSLEMYKNISRTTPKPISIPRAKNDTEHEVLVKFRPDVSLADIKKIAVKNNDTIEDKYEFTKNLVAIDDLDGLDAERVAAQYRRMSNLVEYAEPNLVIKLDPTETPKDSWNLKPNELASPNDPMFADQWALSNDGKNGGKEKADINALLAWKKTQGSEDIVVAVLDSGVDYTHPDLAANIWTRPDSLPAYTDDELGTFNDLHGFNATDNDADPMDDNGHGTHCAGIIGAEGDNDEGIAGINWHVEIMPLKFMGRGGFGTTKDAIEAINYAIERKKDGVNIRVINASWGSTQNSKALEDAIRAANEAGILFVAAAGNDGTSNDKRPHYPSNYDLPNVISVAAIDRADSLTSFSKFGVKTLHIAAPGKDILSTWLNGGYREASGTSMAAPQVAGVAALILSLEPNISVEKLRARILKSVDKIDSLDGKVESGGRLNAAKALGN